MVNLRRVRIEFITGWLQCCQEQHLVGILKVSRPTAYTPEVKDVVSTSKNVKTIAPSFAMPSPNATKVSGDENEKER
jgi:hypothetical protein